MAHAKIGCDWFKHSKNMRNDLRIRSFRKRLGSKEYSVLIMLYEVLTSMEGQKFKICPSSVQMLSDDFDISVSDIEKVIEVGSELGLFRSENDLLTAPYLDEIFRDFYGKNGISDENPTKSEGGVEKVNSRPSPPIRTRKEEEQDLYPFDLFWNSYGKKQKRSIAERIYSKLTDAEKEAIFATLPKFLKYNGRNGSQFIPHPSTYLNQKRWEDEIPEIETPKGQIATDSPAFNQVLGGQIM